MTSLSIGDSFVSSPLRDGLFEDFCSFLEWILDVRLTVEARDLIRDLVHFWSTNNQMENVEEYLSIHNQVRKETKATQDYVREKLQIQFVADLRLLETNGNPGIRAVLQLYDAANVPLAPGNPTLTQETAECYMEFFYFMRMTLINGIPPPPPPEITKNYFVRQLITKYSYMSREEQEWIGKSPVLWAEYRSKWPKMSEADIAKLLPGWSQQINGSGNIPSFARDNIRDPRDLIKDSRDINSDKNEEEEIKGLEREINEAQTKGDSQRVNELQTEMTKKLQQQQRHRALASRVDEMRNDTKMSIIRNIPSSNRRSSRY